MDGGENRVPGEGHVPDCSCLSQTTQNGHRPTIKIYRGLYDIIDIMYNIHCTHRKHIISSHVATFGTPHGPFWVHMIGLGIAAMLG